MTEVERGIPEQALIGCLLIDPAKVMPELASRLTAQCFSSSDCRTIYSACERLFAAQKPIDSITILEEIGYGQAEYKPHLAKLVAAAPTVKHFREYLEIVETNAIRSKAIENADGLGEALERGDPLPTCRELAAQLVQDMSTAQGNCISAAEGYALVLDGLDKPKEFLQTGFSNLDRYVLLQRGDYLVIGGRPSAGKTAFSLQVVLNMARRHNVCYFSLETSAQKIYERLLSCYTLTSFDQITRGHVEDKSNLLKAREDFTKLKLHVIDSAGWTVEQIKAQAIQKRAEVVVIDYLGLISAEGRSVYERVTNTSRGLHIMAQQGRIAVVALSQLNRAGNSEPDMTSLRESGQIEQDADAILLLNTPGDKEKKQASQRDLIIAKNKTGRVGKMLLAFDGGLQRFAEICERGDAECRPF